MLTLRPLVGAFSLALAFVSAPAAAQRTSRPVGPGDTLRLRIAGDSARVDGVLVQVGADDTLRVQNRWWREAGAVPLQYAVAVHDVRRMEVKVRSESSRTASVRYAAIGAVAGAAAFHLVARATLRPGPAFATTGFMRSVTVFGGTMGAFTGVLAGLAAPREYWRPATLPSR